MNELQTRINTVIQIIASEASKVNKVVASLQAFSGLDITHFSDKKKKAIYTYMAKMNDITSRYAIKTKDDYKVLLDEDLNKILKSVQQLCLKLLLD